MSLPNAWPRSRAWRASHVGAVPCEYPGAYQRAPAASTSSPQRGLAPLPEDESQAESDSESTMARPVGSRDGTDRRLQVGQVFSDTL